VQLLLNAKAALGVFCQQGVTALHLAAIGGHVPLPLCSSC
jgi:hypothetical protein